jgi:major vault protein
MSSVLKILPFNYVHVLDKNKGNTRVIVGPRVYTPQEHEKVIGSIEPMKMIPPRHYILIRDPVVRDEQRIPQVDAHGNFRLHHGDEEYRFDSFNEGQPFFLYPGEKELSRVTPLQIVSPDQALQVRCVRDFKDGDILRTAGDEWLIKGPVTYLPRIEESVTETVQSTVITQGEALQIKARKQCIDYHGISRKSGEEWLIREIGAYLRGVDEQIVKTVQALVLTHTRAIHLRATRTFTDVYGIQRKAGEEWLVTHKMADAHIIDVHEQIVNNNVCVTVLNTRQFCVVLDPVGKDGKQNFGRREIRKGEDCFFLQPGERLESGIQNIFVLGEEEALLLCAREEYKDIDVKRNPGDRWMIYGPCDYVPPTEIIIVERRSRIPLDENEGIYVRDIKKGSVTSIIGKSYMLAPNEELWEKELPDIVEKLLGTEGSRVKSKVVTYRVPQNSCVQIYDYKEKRSRIAFGPALVLLGPDEQFTVLSLSGGKPKYPHRIKALELKLGPEFMTDIVTVETMDHANLSLRLSYNWYFHLQDLDGRKLFQVPDFIGDACKAIAGRVRGSVASVPFDIFHKKSARIIREAVFGVDENGSIRDNYTFDANNLVITNIDIQGVEPVDHRTRMSLQKSVQLAIEITTKSQEARARHEAERLEQEAKGRLERQRIVDDVRIEDKRKELISLQVESAHIEAAGQSTAEAKAKAAVASIEGTAAVTQATLLSQASQAEADTDLSLMRQRQEINLEHRKQLTELEIAKSQELAAIEAEKFRSIVNAIGAETIRSIAQAGPEMQAKLLQGLGLKSFLITDGNSPINLFNTAQGLVGANQ